MAVTALMTSALAAASAIGGAASAATAAVGGLGTLSTAAGALSAGIGGINALRNAKYQSDALQAQAAQAGQAAGSEIQLGLEDSDRTVAGATTIAAKGGGISGSALDVLGDLTRQAGYRMRAAGARGGAEVASLYDAARQTRQAGRLEALGKGIEMGSTILGGVMKAKQATKLARLYAGNGSPFGTPRPLAVPDVSPPLSRGGFGRTSTFATDWGG